MIRLILITLFALVATVASVSAFIPFLPLYPIIWTATAFLLLAELLLAGVFALILSHRTINNTPLTLSFLVFPTAYLLLSLLLVPISAYFTTCGPLLLIHFIVLVLLTLLACCLSGVAARSQAETAQRQEHRFSLRRNALKLYQSSEMLRTAKGEEKKELAKRVERLSEHIKYAPESNDSDDCRICDGEMEQTITEIARLIQDNTFADKDEDFIPRMEARLLSLQQTLDQRKFIITHKI